MNKDEVMKALQEIKESYAPITIDVTPQGSHNTQNRNKARVRLMEGDENSTGEESAELENDSD